MECRFNIVELNNQEERFVSEFMSENLAIDGSFPQEYCFSSLEGRQAYRARFISEAFARKEGVSFALMKGEAVLGLAVAGQSIWDSVYYGHGMYYIDTFFNPCLSPFGRRILITYALERLRRNNKVNLVTANLSAEDKKTALVYHGLGFSESGRQKTLFVSKDMAFFQRLRDNRGQAVGDAPAQQELAELAAAIRFPSRLYNVDLCQPGKVAQMHALWVKQMLARNECDRTIKVYCSEGKAIGLAASEKLDLPAGGDELRVFGRTLFGFLPSKARAGFGIDILLRAGLADALEKSDIVESTVSEQNKVVIRMLFRAGHRVARHNHIMTRIF